MAEGTLNKLSIHVYEILRSCWLEERREEAWPIWKQCVITVSRLTNS